MIVVAGPASPKLGRRIASSLKCGLAPLEWKRFPDGESYIRIPFEMKGESVIVVQSTSLPQDKRLMELFFILDLIGELGAREVTVVIPYLAYMRQDKRFRDGEVVSVRVVSKLIESFNVDKVVLVDVHSKLVLDYFNVDVVEVSAMPLIGSYLSSLNLSNPFVLAPDRKALNLAKMVADGIGCDYDFLEKRRDKITGEVKTYFKEMDVRDRDVVIVDDIISTGGTIANAAEIARNLGARRIYAACTHALLVGDALMRLSSAGVFEIIGTDTIESNISKVSVAPAIASIL